VCANGFEIELEAYKDNWCAFVLKTKGEIYA